MRVFANLKCLDEQFATARLSSASLVMDVSGAHDSLGLSVIPALIALHALPAACAEFRKKTVISLEEGGCNGLDKVQLLCDGTVFRV